MAVDLRALRTFLAVVEARSFSAAAQTLGYTQSAVSQQIASLERELGVALLSRRPVEPTRAGAALVEQGRDLVARAEAAAAQARRTAQAAGDHRPARVVVSPSAERALAGSRAIGATEWGSLEVCTSADAVSRLVRGQADLAVVDGITAPSDPLPLDRPLGLVIDVLAEASIDVLLAADHPLARREALDLAHLDHARWLDAAASGIPTAALEAAARRPLRRGLSYDGSSAATVAALVAAGAGLAAVPTGAAAYPGVVAVRLRAPALAHRIELWRHDADRAPVTRAAAALVGARSAG